MRNAQPIAYSTPAADYAVLAEFHSVGFTLLRSTAMARHRSARPRHQSCQFGLILLRLEPRDSNDALRICPPSRRCTASSPSTYNFPVLGTHATRQYQAMDTHPRPSSTSALCGRLDRLGYLAAF